MALLDALWLSPAIRRVQPFIKSGVRRGLSASEIGRVLRKTGQGVRRTDLLAAVRHEKGIEVSSNRLSSIRKDRMFNPASLSEAATKIRRQFSFTVRVRGIHTESKKPITKFVTVTTDTILTRGQIEDAAEKLVTDRLKDSKATVESSLLVEGVRSGSLGLM